jgi:hypothetical protein
MIWGIGKTGIGYACKYRGMPEIVVDLEKTVSRIERQQDMEHA